MSKTVAERIEQWLADSADVAFIRPEFNGFGSSSQVGRALRELVKAGKLVKIGYGMYAKARRSSQTGNPVPIETLMMLAWQVLPKLGVTPELGRSAKEYSEGRSTQIPMATVVNVGRSRIRRKLSFGPRVLRYERDPTD